jgi:hypothetical protein
MIIIINRLNFLCVWETYLRRKSVNQIITFSYEGLGLPSTHILLYLLLLSLLLFPSDTDEVVRSGSQVP